MGLTDKIPGWNAETKGKRWGARAAWVLALVVVLGAFGGGGEDGEGGDVPAESTGPSDDTADTTTPTPPEDDASGDDAGDAVGSGGDSGGDQGSTDTSDSTGDTGSDDGTDGGDAAADETEPPTRTPPAAIEFGGEGDSVTDEFPTENAVVRFEMGHGGSSNFAIWVLDADTGEKVELAVNEIGSYHGAHYFVLDPGTYLLDVTADGGWGVTITQPEPTNGDAVPATLSGNADAAPPALQLSEGLHRFAFTHEGDSNFAVWLYDEQGGAALLANEIGAYSGETALRIPADGHYFLDVTGNGPWTIDLTA